MAEHRQLTEVTAGKEKDYERGLMPYMGLGGGGSEEVTLPRPDGKIQTPCEAVTTPPPLAPKAAMPPTPPVGSDHAEAFSTLHKNDIIVLFLPTHT